MCAGCGYKTNHIQIKKRDNTKMALIEPNNTICLQKQTKIKRDVLAVLTYQTKIFLRQFNEISEQVQNSYFYRLLMKTTQPAHLITLISVIILAKVLIPTERSSELSPPPVFMKLLYLGCFAAHFGIQVWMTFVSGLALYLALPRHTFGGVQKILFPKYFLLNAVLSLVTLCTFMKYHGDVDLWNGPVAIQVVTMVVCFCVELAIRLYMTPRLVQLMTDKNVMEAEAGVGTEVGDHKPGCLSRCPVYVQLHSTFRKVHMTIAIGNMVSMACTTLHLYYLSEKIAI